MDSFYCFVNKKEIVIEWFLGSFFKFFLSALNAVHLLMYIRNIYICSSSYKVSVWYNVIFKLYFFRCLCLNRLIWRSASYLSCEEIERFVSNNNYLFDM